MALFTISDMDDLLADRLRSRAAAHGRTLEQEVCAVLEEAMGNRPPNHGQKLIDTINAEFGPLGGVDLDLPSRFSNRELPKFDDH